MPLHLVSWEQTTITLSMFVVALGVLYRQCVRPVIRFFRRIMEAVERVEHQVQPNNGSSMRDELKRVEATVSEMQSTLDGVVEIVKRIPR